MNLISALVKCLIFLFTCNRTLLLYSTFMDLTQKRKNDVFLMDNACNVFDYKDMGDHADYCRKIERRLSMSIMFHTIQEVVNDTLYQELSFGIVMQVTALLTSILVVGGLYNKFIKTINIDLPVYSIKKSLKND
jgi:hypothetical protein